MAKSKRNKYTSNGKRPNVSGKWRTSGDVKPLQKSIRRLEAYKKGKPTRVTVQNLNPKDTRHALKTIHLSGKAHFNDVKAGRNPLGSLA